MSDEQELRRQLEKAEYRAKLIESELSAVRASRAYQLSKKAGIIRKQIKSNPTGLAKKAVNLILTDPKRARHMLRSAGRGAFMQQSAAEQGAKYQEWILLNEPDDSELEAQRHVAEHFAYKPLISIITPVFNPPTDVFEELIESVLEQTYSNFELCLGNFGDAPEIEEMIARYAKLDARIKHLQFSENLGIAGNSNLIFEKAEGEYIALLDHDDTLSPDALYENVRLLNEKSYDFIYSDKDKIDEKGNRFDPLFKPQLSPEMLLNVNYLTHLNVMRTSIVKKIGAWDPDTDGAQDWDLFLRVMSASKLSAHIPKVLYHWRVIATSTAMSIDTKPYALANQCKAIDKYLKEKSIPAHAYVKKTELFLQWDEAYVDQSPIVFIDTATLADTMRLMRQVRKATTDPTFILIVDPAKIKTVESIAKRSGVSAVLKNDASLFTHIGQHLPKTADTAKPVLFLLGKVRLIDEKWYGNLTGWLTIKEVAAVSGRLQNQREIIVSSGGVISSDEQYLPLFTGYPRYFQSYMGNSEWVRNLSVLPTYFCATTIADLRSYIEVSANTAPSVEAYFLWLSSQGHRLVMTPHATAQVYGVDLFEVPHELALKTKKPFTDPFNNPNMSTHDPMRLFEEERLPGVESGVTHDPIDRYQHDATILSGTFDITAEEIERNQENQMSTINGNPKSVAWFLPSFDVAYAGLMNIFHFADYLQNTQKLKTTFYILTGEKDAEVERKVVVAAVSGLAEAHFVALRPDDTTKIGAHDIGIATQWASTFPLAKATNIKHKAYFIQDNEANFYPKGTISALVSLGYQFGFTAIAGTDGLLEMYERDYGGRGVVLKSKVNLTAYHPRKDPYYEPKEPYKVFFYARPNMPRNAFELGIAGLKKLKHQLGDDVEIITAGAEWDANAYGVEGMFTNLGKIAYDAVPKLYRSVDAGLMFMFSGHPGVTASELMASGCPVVVNEYNDKTWHELYRNEDTCLTSVATASEVARNLTRCLTEPETRKRLIDGGLSITQKFYTGYEQSQAKAYEYLLKEYKK